MRRIPRAFMASMALLISLGVVFAADKPEPTVTVEGNVTKAQTWTTTQIKADFQKEGKTITYTEKNVSHSAFVVPLLSLIKAAEPKLDPKIKSHELRFVVVVEGKDGYMATFALGELTPEIGNREVWIALDVDDKPLSDRGAPASLIVPADQKAQRWVQGIRTIRVVDMGVAPKDQ